MRFAVKSCLACCLFLVACEPVDAQLFGERTLGRSVSRRQPVDPEAVGTVDSSRRFIRGQRQAGDVVGANQPGAQGFVGSQQGTTNGAVTSSVTGLREQRSVNVNRPRRVATGGRYAERLSIHFESPAVTANSTTALSPLLKKIITKRGIEIEVLQAGHVAVLRGVVSCEHDREIAALLVMFEPGIESVKNELKVQ